MPFLFPPNLFLLCTRTSGNKGKIKKMETDTQKIPVSYTHLNNAAGILADKNHFPGIDIVKFGENISIIQKRSTFENVSVLEVYEKAIEVFRDYYQYEVIPVSYTHLNLQGQLYLLNRYSKYNL